jgi:hypothetical protein
MEIDTSRTMEIQSSPLRLLLIGVGGLAMAALSLGMAREYAGTGSFRELVGWVGAVFFGIVFVFAIWRGARATGPVVTLSPQGFRDTRISSEVIPWTLVQRISTWQYRGTKIIVIKVPDNVWQDFPLSRIARWSRSANVSLGADGLAIATVELKVKFDELMEMMTAYAQAYSGKAG